jgi:hypothetical protein
MSSTRGSISLLNPCFWLSFLLRIPGFFAGAFLAMGLNCLEIYLIGFITVKADTDEVPDVPSVFG